MTLGEFLKSYTGSFDLRLYDGNDFLFRTNVKSKALKAYENRKIETWDFSAMLNVFRICLEKE